jgi:RNA polymerase sigma-70 factor (ECF subfamily)
MTHHTTALLQRFRTGDPDALNDLLAHTRARLQHIAHRMLRTYPVVQRWDRTDDVLQSASLRLCRAVEAERPESARHFYNLAATQIHRELKDLADRYRGPLGFSANHGTDPLGLALAGAADPNGEPTSPAEWGEFHQIVGALPDEQRELFGLIWYDGLTQDEAAEVLGVSVRTIKRWWQATRVALALALRAKGAVGS